MRSTEKNWCHRETEQLSDQSAKTIVKTRERCGFKSCKNRSRRLIMTVCCRVTRQRLLHRKQHASSIKREGRSAFITCRRGYASIDNNKNKVFSGEKGGAPKYGLARSHCVPFEHLYTGGKVGGIMHFPRVNVRFRFTTCWERVAGCEPCTRPREITPRKVSSSSARSPKGDSRVRVSVSSTPYTLICIRKD